MNNEMYQMIANKEEMRWFFDHCIFKPTVLEMYTLEFVCRHKKLTDEEKQTLGLTRKEAEFLATQTVRANKIADGEKIEDKPWTFDKFFRHVSRFNVSTDGFTTSKGERLPQKSLVVLCYVNPGDGLKVADEMIAVIDKSKTSLVKALFNGKSYESVAQLYQTFTNLESSFKHLQANCKGTTYWMDFDIDVPTWFKESYYNDLVEVFTRYVGKRNYVIVDTGGGYHVLLRTIAVKFNPHNICKEVDAIYKKGVTNGNSEYVNEKGDLKYECTINDSQIPGIPLPGTYQYGRPVTVLNKTDFE